MGTLQGELYYSMIQNELCNFATLQALQKCIQRKKYIYKNSTIIYIIYIIIINN